MKDISAENRKFYMSTFMLLVLVAMVCYLTFIPVPTDNKDMVIAVLGVILGAGSSALSNLFGDKDAEKEELLKRIAKIENQYALLATKYDTLKGNYDQLTAMLVERHVVEGQGNK